MLKVRSHTQTPSPGPALSAAASKTPSQPVRPPASPYEVADRPEALESSDDGSGSWDRAIESRFKSQSRSRSRSHSRGRPDWDQLLKTPSAAGSTRSRSPREGFHALNHVGPMTRSPSFRLTPTPSGGSHPSELLAADMRERNRSPSSVGATGNHGKTAAASDRSGAHTQRHRSESPARSKPGARQSADHYRSRSEGPRPTTTRPHKVGTDYMAPFAGSAHHKSQTWPHAARGSSRAASDLSDATDLNLKEELMEALSDISDIVKELWERLGRQSLTELRGSNPDIAALREWLPTCPHDGHVRVLIGLILEESRLEHVPPTTTGYFSYETIEHIIVYLHGEFTKTTIFECRY